MKEPLAARTKLYFLDEPPDLLNYEEVFSFPFHIYRELSSTAASLFLLTLAYILLPYNLFLNLVHVKTEDYPNSREGQNVDVT